ALLKSVPKWADGISEKDLAISKIIPNIHYEFPVRVQGVLALFIRAVSSGGVDWCDKDYSNSFIYLDFIDYRFLPFVGKDIYFMSYGSGSYYFNIHLLGFYKKDN
ncbi:unnamed protein product, partial [marine sediment metagenome]